MSTINRWVDQLEKLLVYIAAVTLFLLMILVFVEIVFLRLMLNSSIPGLMEFIGEYLMVIMVYFTVSYAQKNKFHINIDFFQEKFSPKVKKVTMILSNLLSIVLFLFVAYHNFLKSLQFVEQDIRSVGLLNYPLAPALVIIVIGTIVLSIRLFIQSIQLVRAD